MYETNIIFANLIRSVCKFSICYDSDHILLFSYLTLITDMVNKNKNLLNSSVDNKYVIDYLKEITQFYTTDEFSDEKSSYPEKYSNKSEEEQFEIFFQYWKSKDSSIIEGQYNPIYNGSYDLYNLSGNMLNKLLKIYDEITF